MKGKEAKQGKEKDEKGCAKMCHTFALTELLHPLLLFYGNVCNRLAHPRLTIAVATKLDAFTPSRDDAILRQRVYLIRHEDQNAVPRCHLKESRVSS